MCIPFVISNCAKTISDPKMKFVFKRGIKPLEFNYPRSPEIKETAHGNSLFQNGFLQWELNERVLRDFELGKTGRSRYIFFLSLLPCSLSSPAGKPRTWKPRKREREKNRRRVANGFPLLNFSPYTSRREDSSHSRKRASLIVRRQGMSNLYILDEKRESLEGFLRKFSSQIHFSSLSSCCFQR